MATVITPIPLETVCVLAERWPVHPFKGQFPDPRFQSQIVHYSVDFKHKPYLIDSARNLTVIALTHTYEFCGSPEEYGSWSRTKGISHVVRSILDLVNDSTEIT